MQLHRLWRLAAACRPFLLTSLSALAVLLGSRPALAADITGQVVDASGRPVPRAYVRITDSGGRVSSEGFSDAMGRFRLEGSTGCTVGVTLTGFTAVTTPCGSGEGVRVMLEVAPIREDIIVSATRTETPAGQVGGSLTVFNEDDLLERQEPLVIDLLVGTPGTMLLRNGGPGTVTSMFVRGGESDYNKILLDGVPLNEPGGTFFMSNLTTENLERIEILRGAYSSLFGSDAMSSVIQLFTKLPEGASSRPHLNAQFDGGTYGTMHESAAINGNVRRFGYSFGAARYDSDNRLPNSALGNTTISGTAGLTLSPSARLRFVGRTEREHVGTPGTTAFGRPDLDAFFERHDRVIGLTFDQTLGSMFRQRVSFSQAGSNQQSTNLVADPSFTPSYQGRTGTFTSFDFLSDTTNELRRNHVSYQADLQLTTSARAGNHLVTVLADYDGERLTAISRPTSPTGTLTSTDSARDNFGISFQEQMAWRQLFITIGGRIEKNDSFGTEFIPRGSVVFVAHERQGALLGDTRLHAGAGIGVKEPTMLESFGTSVFALGNPDLKPERSRSAELGIEQRLAQDRVRLAVAYFDNHFTDVINTVTTNPSTFAGQYFNVAETRGRGVEFGGEAALTKIFRVRAGYTWLDGEVLSASTPTTVFTPGNELFRRPRHSGSVGVTALVSRVTAVLNGSFIGEFVDNDFGTFFPSFDRNPGHNLWDARITMKATDQIRLFLAIDNLTDTDYSEPLGYQPLLRTFRGGVRVTF